MSDQEKEVILPAPDSLSVVPQEQTDVTFLSCNKLNALTGEDAWDDTLPVVVHFSTSDDTVSTFPLEGDNSDVHFWQAPDFMTETLFVDFLMEIVDAVSSRDTKTFLSLLQLSEMKDLLIRLNQKRKRWFVGSDDNSCSLRIREVCSDFSYMGHLVALNPPQGSLSIESIDVLVNNEIDPSGELRKKINQIRAANIELYEELEAVEEPEEREDVFMEDEYSSDEEEEFDEEVQSNPEKPCYYPSQIEMATILKKRIDTIMRHYHKIAKLSDVFDKVDFTVYTARYRMLSDQTEKRICHPDAGVLSREELEARNESNARKRMFMYVRSAETDTHFEQLKKDVQENPKTLFVIIADECHWGITKDRDQKPSAHNLFINEWCKDDSPRNVVVVQISATPFNLLTKNSRLPELRCHLLGDATTATQNNHNAGDLVVPEHELHETVKKTSKQVELHVVHWSEVELKNFESGMKMKLRSALVLQDSPYQYLHLSPEGMLGLTPDEKSATEFIVQGKHGIVLIKAMVSREKSLTITRDENGRLEGKADPAQPTKFEIKLDFGVGVAAFSCCGKEHHYLAVDENSTVTLQAAKVETKRGVSVMKPKHDVAKVSFEFYIDQCGPAEVNVAGQQYMSLNYYLSTINCNNKNDQKIREDAFFQTIVDKAKRQKKLLKDDSSSFKIDALLCAEYCYHVLHFSVYDSDDRIREALTSDINQSPAALLERKLHAFMRKLKDDKGTKYIHPEAFELVRREIRDKVKQDFKGCVKGFAKGKKPKASTENTKQPKELGKMIYLSFVACLMYLSTQDLDNALQETRAAAIIEGIRETLQKENCQKMIEIWKAIVEEYETSSLITSLIQSGKSELGKMKIVRAKSMETANQFFHTLQLARAIASLEECFEIIRDYGGIQIEKQLMKSSSPFFLKLQPVYCQYKFDCGCNDLELQHGRKKCLNCKHVHKSITQYEDLENLACILILVDKGRMGDTFPQSFDCLDLRLNYDNSREFKEGSPLFLSTVIQELGRMCRYVKVNVGESRGQNTPYVLVGRELYKRLEDSLQKSPAMSAISCTRADRYMTTSRRSKSVASSSLRWLDHEAHKDSYDHGNKQTHCNRILLQAEPQIGKTGTYLCLIKLLRLDILGREKVPSTTAIACDEGSFYLHKEGDLSEDFTAEDTGKQQDWEFPYWKTIQESSSLLDKTVVPGKYSVGGCFYTHDTEESPFVLMKRHKLKPTRSSHYYQKVDYPGSMRTWHWYHFQNCPECGKHLQGQEPVEETITVELDNSVIDVKCSWPVSTLRYSHLQKYLNEDWTKRSWASAMKNASNLGYWIFHPSHRDDPRRCLLNYHHVMQNDNSFASYVQVAIVRSEKFKMYQATWGKTLAILQLPDRLPGCEVRPSEGGVGYARLFIQKLAFALKLEYVFVIDDNVAVMSEVVFSSGNQQTFCADVSRDENGVITMDRCSFFKPLSHLYKIAEGKEIPPCHGEPLEPHPFKHHPQANDFPLYSYTGPAKLFADLQHGSYGVLGLLRSVPRAARPFAKTQVYAVVLLNVKSTVEKKVFYRPWPCWEDLRFNDDCDKAGLWVVKCNRYHFLKVQYNDWINSLTLPRIFHWKEDSTLEQRPFSSELTEEFEELIVLEHLRDLVHRVGLHKCFKGQIGYERPDDCKETLSPVKIVDKLTANEATEEAIANEIPVLIVSYSALSRTTNDMMLLNSRFCATKEKIVFITCVKDAIVRWPRLSLTTVPTHDGICLFSEMSDRNAQFSILSAADPKRHTLRWILIEASFPTNEMEIIPNVQAEGTFSEYDVPSTKQELYAKERLPLDHCRYSENDGNNATKLPNQSGQFQQSFSETQPSQADRHSQESYSKQQSPDETDSKKRNLLLNSNRSLTDSPNKRRRIEEYFSPEAQYSNIEDSSVNSKKKNKGKLKKDVSSANTSCAYSSQEKDVVETNLGSKHRASVTQSEEDEIHEVHDGSQSSATSVYSTSDDEMECANTPEMHNTLISSENDVQAEFGSISGASTSNTTFQETSTNGKISPNDSAYTTGTNLVTKTIVDLWGKYKKMRRNNEGDLTQEQIKNALDRFRKDDLQMADNLGYTALLKACSLPSVSPHLMQYLIVTRKVDLNCTLPHQFNTNHEEAKGLVPGMCPLSVAMRRSNTNCISTFMRRQREVDVRSADEDGNTALHHCVLMVSKGAFQKLFPLYKPLKWKNMLNSKRDSPLEIARNLKSKIFADPKSRTKKQTLKYILEEMEGMDLSSALSLQ